MPKKQKYKSCWTCRKFSSSGTSFPGTCKPSIHLPEKEITGEQSDKGCDDYEGYGINDLLRKAGKIT